MTIEQTITKAIEGGWKDYCYGGKNGEYESTQNIQFVLDPFFWQSLGKAMGWKGSQEYPNEWNGEPVEWWLFEWHRFIDTLAEGRTAESFFETLT